VDNFFVKSPVNWLEFITFFYEFFIRASAFEFFYPFGKLEGVLMEEKMTGGAKTQNVYFRITELPAISADDVGGV
jgi:hypothetical protein